MYFKNTQLMLTKSYSSWFSDWISREKNQSFSFAFCLFRIMQEKKKLMAIGELQLGFPSASLGTFSQVPQSRNFGQGQRDLVSFN